MNRPASRRILPVTPEMQDDYYEKRKIQEQMEAIDTLEDDVHMCDPHEYEVNNYSVNRNYTNEDLH